MITLDDIYSDDNMIDDCNDFYSNIYDLKKFGYYCNPKIFKYLFGEEGEILWNNFVNDAERNIYEFYFNYLVNDQQFVLTANILNNEEELRMLVYS